MATHAVETNKGKRWYFSFTFGGANITSSVIYITKQEAEEEENKHYYKLVSMFKNSVGGVRAVRT